MPVETWEVQGLAEVNATLQEHMQLLREIPEEAKTIGESMSELTKVERQYRRGIVAIRTEWRNQHAAWIETMRIGRRVQAIFRDFRQIFETYTLSQIRIERLTRDVTDAQKDVAYYQNLYNQYLHDFGEESALTLGAYDNLQKAMEDAKDAQDQLNKANQDAKFLWLGVAEGIMSTAFNVTGIAMNLAVLTKTVGGASGALASLKGGAIALTVAMGGLGGVIAPVAVGVAMLGTAFYLAGLPIEKQNKLMKEWSNALADVEEHGKGAIQNLDKQREAFDNARRGAEEYKGAIDDLFKHSPLPELKTWLETVTQSLKETSLGFAAGRTEIQKYQTLQTRQQRVAETRRELSRIPTVHTPTVRSVTIQNRFSGNIASDVDIDHAMLRSYTKLMRMLETVA